MKQLLFLIGSFCIFWSQDSLNTNLSNNIEHLINQNTKLSDHFYVRYTIGKEATENIKTNFYILTSVRQNMIGAMNATAYNMNWAQQIHNEQKNLIYRGINPIGLLYVMATWSGLVPDPTTENAIQKSMREFIGVGVKN